jgi:hypothetical protein
VVEIGRGQDPPVGDGTRKADGHTVEARQRPYQAPEGAEQPGRRLADGCLHLDLGSEERPLLVEHRGLDPRAADVDGEGPRLASL